MQIVFLQFTYVYNCKHFGVLLIIHIFEIRLFYKIKMFIFVKNRGYGRKTAETDEKRRIDFESAGRNSGNRSLQYLAHHLG